MESYKIILGETELVLLGIFAYILLSYLVMLIGLRFIYVPWAKYSSVPRHVIEDNTLSLFIGSPITLPFVTIMGLSFLITCIIVMTLYYIICWLWPIWYTIGYLMLQLHKFSKYILGLNND